MCESLGEKVFRLPGPFAYLGKQIICHEAVRGALRPYADGSNQFNFSRSRTTSPTMIRVGALTLL